MTKLFPALAKKMRPFGSTIGLAHVVVMPSSLST
jgi:hypothetical protein